VQVDLYQGDLTLFACDAMVNAANEQLAGGGGVDGAIHRAGGPEIMAACRFLGSGCPTGSAVSTTAGKLPATWVIHAVGPIWQGGAHDEAKLLASAYTSSLAEAERLGACHVAIPSLSTGAYNYPVDKAAEVAIAAIRAYLDAAASGARLGRITLVSFSGDDYRTYQQALFRLIPDND
jgi:O-acetyl-ADP-ribose deacetylase (regulator of RNase III)